MDTLSTTTAWTELVKLALLGTDRSNLSTPLQTNLQLLGIDTQKEIAEIVLEGATLLASLRRAGFEPKIFDGEELTPCPKETLFVCSEKSIKHLLLILSGRYSLVLDEFVEHLNLNKKSLPFELLPPILDKCLKSETLWNQLNSVIGNRGHWLIRLNPIWQSLRRQANREEWNLATLEDRKKILKYIRTQNPFEGLEMILETWVEDGLSEKVAFLKGLQVGLSDIDEVFLEENLDFPRKEVREVAANLLSQLPNSQLQKEVFQALQESIYIKKDKAGNPKLDIQLPSLTNKTLIRYGINPKKKWKKGNVNAGMLFQMIKIVPPKKWEIYFNLEPNEILQLFIQNEWALILVEGLMEATALHPSPKWIETIIHFWLNNYNRKNWADLNILPIIDLLPHEFFNSILLDKLKVASFLPPEQSPIIFLLQREAYQWEDGLIDIFIRYLVDWIKDNPSFSWAGYQYRTVLKRAAYAVNPKVEKKLKKRLLHDNINWGGWERDIQQFLSIIQFRREIIEELEKPPLMAINT